MENEEKIWAGWKDISLSKDLIGETITKGSGVWEKEYTYIKIPKGYDHMILENMIEQIGFLQDRIDRLV